MIQYTTCECKESSPDASPDDPPDLLSGSWYEHQPIFHSLFDGDTGRVKGAKEKWSRPEYAAALERLAREGGVEEFYTGEMGEAVVRAVKAHGGFMTMEDLAGEYDGERKCILPPGA